MRIGINAIGSRKLSSDSNAMLHSLKQKGHDSVLTSDYSYSLGSFDFLIFVTEPKGMFGGLLSSVPQDLAKSGDLVGKRCLAMVQKRGFRSGHTLKKLMEALEHEGLVIVQGEVFSNTDTAIHIIAEVPLKRG